MAWSYLSCFGVVARISVPNLVEITKPVQAGPATGGSGSLYARRDWILRRSSGGPATSASVVDLRIRVQHFGVSAVRVLALFLFWPTLAGLLFSAAGSGRRRFFGIGSCLITGLWWFSLATTAAISMGAAPIARHPTKFLIPADYVGWVAVKYGEPKAPALQINNGSFVCQIPSDGLLVTSSPLEQGWAKDEYFYYSQDGSTHALSATGWGRGGMIWGGSNEWQQTPCRLTSVQITSYFYVGPEERYHRAVSSNESRPFNESAGQTVPSSR